MKDDALVFEEACDESEDAIEHALDEEGARGRLVASRTSPLAPVTQQQERDVGRR